MRRNHKADRGFAYDWSAHPVLHGVLGRGDIGRRRYWIGAEQLPRPRQEPAHLIQLLL